MEDWKEAFGEEWDAVVLGTGMKECLLSGLLSVAGKKVLHLDKNDYYGGASASLDIHQLFKKFGEEQPPTEAELGKLRDYSVDLVPKFIMAGGQLVKVLVHTKVADYMEFKQVDGSFCYSSRAGKVCKVPATAEDAMKSSLMGMMEKTRVVQMTLWVNKVKLGDRTTWKAGTMTKTMLPLDTMTGDKFFQYWALEKSSIEFFTHTTCLYRDEVWRNRPAIELVKRMQLYQDSMTRFGLAPSPYMYPLYGLGELPQAFARLAAVHGGTYMLNRGADDGPVFGEGKFELVKEEGKAVGVKVKETVANAKIVVASPDYFPEMCSNKGNVVRAIAIVNEPVPNTLTKTGPAHSYQIIFPGASIGRTNDLYLFCCSNSHKVAPDGKYLVFISTNLEGSPPDASNSLKAVAERELAAGLSMLKGQVKIWYEMTDLLVPNTDGTSDNVFLTQSFDATTHFETAITDVLDVYKRITGSDLVLTDPAAASSSE